MPAMVENSLLEGPVRTRDKPDGCGGLGRFHGRLARNAWPWGGVKRPLLDTPQVVVILFRLVTKTLYLTLIQMGGGIGPVKPGNRV